MPVFPLLIKLCDGGSAEMHFPSDEGREVKYLGNYDYRL